MHLFPLSPIAVPGLIALAAGFLAFLLALTAARRRGRQFAGASESGGRRAPASILWIIVQGMGIGLAAAGPVRPGLAPGSPLAIADAVAVAALMFGAAALFDWSSRTMGKNWALVARTRSDATLVTSGPFAIVRNPIYIALAMIMLALAIAAGHLANLLVAAPLFVLGTWMRVVHEEAILRAEFGADYDAYARSVKRFVPGIL